MTELIEAAIMEDMTSIGDLSAQDVSDIWWRVSQSIATNYVDKKVRCPSLPCIVSCVHRRSTQMLSS